MHWRISYFCFFCTKWVCHTSKALYMGRVKQMCVFEHPINAQTRIHPTHAQPHPGSYYPLILSIVFNDFVSRQRRPCPYMPENTFSHGAANTGITRLGSSEKNSLSQNVRQRTFRYVRPVKIQLRLRIQISLPISWCGNDSGHQMTLVNC